MIEIDPVKDLNAEIRIHGSKSFTQRALIIAALAKGKSRLGNIQICDDSQYLINALNEFGIKITLRKRVATVKGVNGALRVPKKELFIGNAGTAMRFLTGLSTLNKGNVVLTCNKEMKKRPMADLIRVLQKQGIRIESKNGFPPIKIKSNGISGGNIKLKGNISSQYISSLLLIGPYTSNPLNIELTTTLTSKPYVDITLDTMRSFGSEWTNKNYKLFSVNNGKKYQAKNYFIAG